MIKVNYVCKRCKTINVIEGFWNWFWTPHVGSKKHMQCKYCGKFQIMPRADGLKFIDWPKNIKHGK